ncbi:unnamed protein product [Orchesella dallaii]|uniref:Transmembrane protein n=1 Tax=Orchesella dallaii TaxID=48710 RepID=A0ABP1RHL6_9HEXA
MLLLTKFRFFLHAFFLFPSIIPINSSTPLKFLEDCVINTVSTNFTATNTLDDLKQTQIQSETQVVLTFVHHKFQNFDYSFDEFKEYADDHETLTMGKGYLKYLIPVKYRENCIVFIFFTTVFEDAISGIHYSGLGTSDNAIFFVSVGNLTEEDEIINGFLFNLFDSSPSPFHSTIVFFTEHQEFGVFCYFCGNQSEKIVRVKNTSFPEIKRIGNELNSNGHMASAYINDNKGTFKDQQQCFDYPGVHTYKIWNLGEHVHCKKPELWVLSHLQLILNVTFTVNRQQTSHPSEWILNIISGENRVLRVPKEYLTIRPIETYFIEEPISVIICLPYHDMLGFDFKLISLLDNTTILLIFLTLLCYVYLHKSLCRGLDYVWTFAGRSLQYNHKKMELIFFLISASFFCCVLQSYISADSFKFLEFPSFSSLLSIGYRVWVDSISFYRRVFNTMMDLTKKKFQDYMGLDPIDALFEGKGVDDIVSFKDDSIDLFLAGIKRRLIITSASIPKLSNAIGNRVVHILENYMCKPFYLRELYSLSVSLRFAMQTQSYLSTRAAKLLRILAESGDYVRMARLKTAATTIFSREFKIRDAALFVQPTALDLSSPIGVSGSTSVLQNKIRMAEDIRSEYESTFCFVCLSSVEIQPGKLSNRRNNWLLRQLFLEFNSFATRYLELPNRFTLKDCENSPGFCESCAVNIKVILELYSELCEVELRFGSKLEELGKLIQENGNKHGETFRSRPRLEVVRDFVTTKCLKRGEELQNQNDSHYWIVKDLQKQPLDEEVEEEETEVKDERGSREFK